MEEIHDSSVLNRSVGCVRHAEGVFISALAREARYASPHQPHIEREMVQVVKLYLAIADSIKMDETFGMFHNLGLEIAQKVSVDFRSPQCANQLVQRLETRNVVR